MVPAQPVVSHAILLLTTKRKYENGIGTVLAQRCLILSVDSLLQSTCNWFLLPCYSSFTCL